MTDDPFGTLGLGADADAGQVREARRRLAAEHHPDRGGDPERMRSINEAADAALAVIALRITDATDRSGDATPQPAREPERDPAHPEPARRGDPDPDLDTRRVQRDVPSFTVEALPVETFEALLIVAAWLGETIDDDPPYRLDTYLGEPFDCWCRLDVVPDAGSSTVSLTVGGIDGAAAPDVIAVRDAWVDGLNQLSAPPPS